MKLRLNATLRAALIAAVTAVGFTLSQTYAAETQLTVNPTEKSGGNTNISWTGGESTLNSWRLTFALTSTNGNSNDFFNISSNNGTAQAGWSLGTNGSDLRLAVNGKNGTPAITISNAFTIGTAQSVTFQFVRNVDEDGDALGTGTFTVSAGGETATYDVTSLEDTALVSGSRGHIWCNGNPGQHQLAGITLYQLDDKTVEVPSDEWIGTEANHTWVAGNFDPAFTTGDNVKFTSTGYKTVEVNSAVESGKMTVQGAAYTFNIQAGASLQAQGLSLSGTGASATLEGAGTYVLPTGVFTKGDLTYGENWTGAVLVANQTHQDGTSTWISNLGSEKSWVEFSNFIGYDSSWAGTVTANIKLTKDGDSHIAWDLTAYASQWKTMTNTGKWKGDGTFRTQGGTSAQKQAIEFAGDISEWTGEFQAGCTGERKIIFSNSATVVNAGIVKIDGASAFTVEVQTGTSFNAAVTADQMIVNAAAKTATLAGTATLGSVAIDAGTLSLAAANLVLGDVSVADGATLSAADDSSATAAITFNPNSSLSVGEDGLVLNGSSTLTFALSSGEHVNFSTSATPGVGDIIVAAGVTQGAINGITFDGDGIANAADYLTLGSLSNYTQLRIKGTNLVLARESDGSYWGMGKGSGNWDLTSANWASSDTLPPADKFSDGDPAYFTENGGGGTITIAQNVKAESINVSGEKEYIFAAGSGTLTVVNSVNVGENAKATFNISLSGETLALNVKDSGTLNVGAGQKLATISGAVTLGNEAVLGGTGSIEAASVVLATGDEENHADLKDGATLKTNSISGKGVLHVLSSKVETTGDASFSNVEFEDASTLTIAADSTLTVLEKLTIEDTSKVVNNGTFASLMEGSVLIQSAGVQLGHLDMKGTLHIQPGYSAGATDGAIDALMVEQGGSFTTTGDLEVTYLSMSNFGDSGTLNVGGDLDLVQTSLGYTKGAVMVKGNTAITGAVNLTSLSSGTLDLTKTGSLTTTGAVDVTGAITLGRLSTSEVYLTADSLSNATTDFVVTLADLEALGLPAGQTVTLANLAKTHGAAGELRINGEEYIQDSRNIIYTISQDKSTYDIILSTENAPSDYIWTNGNETELWSDNLNWSGEQVPDSKAWAQVIDSPLEGYYTIQMNEDGKASRFTVAKNGAAELTDVNDLDIGESLEVNPLGLLGISGEVEVRTPIAKIDGTLVVAESGRLKTQQMNVTDTVKMMEDAYVETGVLNVNGGMFSAVGGELAADSINLAAGALKVDEDATANTNTLNGDADSIIYGPGVLNVNGKGGVYSGAYTQARICVTGQGDQTLAAREGLSAEGSGTVRLQYAAPASIDRVSGNGMTLILNTPNVDSSAATLTLNNPSAVNNGQVIVGLSAVNSAITLNTAAAPVIIQATSLNLGGSTVIVNQTETDVYNLPISTSGQTEGLVLAYLGAEDSFAPVTLSGNLFNRYYINPRLEAGRILVDLNTTHVLDQIEATTYNGRAGAHMLDDAFRQIDPQMTKPTGDLAAVMNALEEGRIPRADTDRMAAAMAGASYAAMGSAFSKDVERQLRSIRNRTTSMGCAECVVNEDMPYVNAWVNAEGEFRKMNRENTLAGYTLNSWGATLGVDVDFTPRFTAGVAFSYLQGDFTSRSADMGDGDLDRMYVSAFARYNRRAWTHTLVGTFGRADASLNRTVDYGAGRYSTKGDTDGTAFGLMYEAGYTVALSEDASTCLQPVFNVLYRHSCLGGYTETGSDAALKYADAEADVVTFGLGARLQSAVGTSAFNRHTLLETRALLKLDAGDRDVTPQANFAGVGGMQNIKSNEYGAFGVEIGAGVMIPIGEGASSLFFDVSAEFRSGYSDVNGAAGYRVNF